MIFQTISLPPCLSTMTWTELAGPIAAVGLNNDATEKPVVPKEEETPVDNAKLLGIALCLGIGSAVGICLMDPGLKTMY